MKNGKQKALIILGGSTYDLPFIKELKKKNYYLFIVDIDINAPGLEYADYPVNLSIKDVDSLVRFFKQKKESFKFVGVTSVDTDANSAIAALSSLLQINSFNFEVSDILSNKFKLYNYFVLKKEIIKESGLNLIPSHIIWYYEDLLDKIKTKKLLFPIILKPTENSGSTGIVIVKEKNKEHNLKKAFLYAKNYSPTGEIIAQEYLKGSVYKIVFLSGKNQIQPILIWNIIYKDNKYPIEIYRNNKINLSLVKKLISIGKIIIEKIGLKNCPVEIKIIKNDDIFYLLDINVRLEGGFFIDKPVYNYLEYDIIENYLKSTIGINPNKFDYIEFLKTKSEKFIFLKKIYDNENINLHIKNDDFRIYKIHSKYIRNDFVSSKYYSNIIYAFSKEEPDFEKIKFEKLKLENNFEQYLLKEARINLNGSCKVCSVCDGKGCIGQIPGMGGENENEVFIKNYYDLRNYKIPQIFYTKNKVKKIINNFLIKKFDSDIFGYKVKFPIFIAPITGIKSNLGGKLDEKEFYISLLKGAIEAGFLSFLGDGSSINKYLYMDKILSKVQYNGIITLKPREINLMLKRIKFFNDKPINAIAIDVDSFNLTTMNKSDSFVKKYSFEELLILKKNSKKTLIIKGIMNFYDMVKLTKYGFESFIISNHGGRVNSSLLSTIEVLKSIDIKYLKKINKNIKIGIDGGFRNGEDIIKAFLLGVDYVLIGRPFAIYAAGGGIEGVKFLFDKYYKQITNIKKYLN